MKLPIAFVLTILPFKAFCCECFTSDFDTIMKYADYAFIGEAIRNIGPDTVLINTFDQEGFGSTVEFKIVQVFKGAIKDKTIIIDQRGNGNCTISFIFGDQYLVFGRKKEMFPSTAEERNFYLMIDDVFSDSSQKELDHKIDLHEKYFRELKAKRSYTYTDGCNVFGQTSSNFAKLKVGN